MRIRTWMCLVTALVLLCAGIPAYGEDFEYIEEAEE